VSQCMLSLRACATELFLSQKYSAVTCYPKLVSLVFQGGNREGREQYLFFWLNFIVRYHDAGLTCVAFSVLLPHSPRSFESRIHSWPSLRMKLIFLCLFSSLNEFLLVS
jgi:hypothetical protein